MHRINLPECTRHLNWIVQLQSDLLYALCDTAIDAIDITGDWIEARRPDIDNEWLERFCGWSKEKSSILDRARAVAALSDADKQSVIVRYQANIRYAEAFDDAIPPPPVTKPLPAGLSKTTALVYRGFFDMFYAPIFYKDKGYPIEAADLNGEQFNKNNYLKEYHRANPKLKVCPLCDGGMDGAELDHWLAKKHLPELNCHPQNLVEICSACNGRTNKGEKLVLDDGVTEPFKQWLHPLLQTATEEFEIDRPGYRVKLVSDDANTQTKLDNFGRLINLGSRWSREWNTQIDRVQAKIRHLVRRGHSLDEISLRTKVESWRDDAKAEIGLAAYSVLEVHVLSSALEEGSVIFAEFAEYATEQA